MGEFTLDELRGIMRTCAGVEDGVDLDGAIDDVPFADLGYDSLAVLEMVGRVERTYGIPLTDDAVSAMPTPGKAVDFINAQMRAREG